MKETLAPLRTFLLDMDGTLYLGERLLPGALEFLERLVATGRNRLFFTNNSSRDAGRYVEKLGKMGIQARPEEIITSGEATIDYLKTIAGVERVYPLGTESFEEEIRRGGLTVDDQSPQAVVLSFDLTLTYEKIRRGCDLIRKGAAFVATHPDLNCPSEEGPLPDCGAMAAMFTAATGVEPTVIGKPHRFMAEAALRRLGTTAAETAIVGDRLYTDMEMGFSAGLTTILVLSGETVREDLAGIGRQPTLVVDSVADLTPDLS